MISGEETVGSRPETAFQYSQVAIDVIKHSPKFENILISQFQEKCAYCVPFYKQRLNNQTEDQYLEYVSFFFKLK